ncbi:MAG: CHAD domain-containing protein [Ignavibacteria bacterium]|nr:CHAD domain-containing protein [Ignavibacteria bacterium]
MKRNYSIKEKQTLRENLSIIIPEMFDEFILYSHTVTNFPLRKNILHEMRKAGKPLRYAMELGEYCFGADFALCHGEIKSSLELMGDIHDVDVMIPEIIRHIHEIRQLNNTIQDRDLKFSTKQLRSTLRLLRNSREKLYGELTEKLNLWEESNFRTRIVISMEGEMNII